MGSPPGWTNISHCSYINLVHSMRRSRFHWGHFARLLIFRTVLFVRVIIQLYFTHSNCSFWFICYCSLWLLFGIRALQWRHNERDGVSNHQPGDCLLNRLFGLRSKITSKLRVTGLWWGIHRWIPHTKGQLLGKCFHMMTSSWFS